ILCGREIARCFECNPNPANAITSRSQSSLPIRIVIDQAAIESFCRRWGVTELELFGSAIRDDFGADSDVDILARSPMIAGRHSSRWSKWRQNWATCSDVRSIFW